MPAVDKNLPPDRAVQTPSRNAWIDGGEGFVLFAAEALLAALVLYAMDALLHLRLGVSGFVASVAPWPACLLLGRLLRGRVGWGGRFSRVVELLLPGFVLWLCDRMNGLEWTAGRIAYAVLATSGLILAWRLWLRLATANGAARPSSEALRLLLAGAVALWAIHPYITFRLVGGVDARWYAYTMRDFIDQWRAGVFPVFLGLGDFAPNGSAHPIRTAPFHFYLGGLWDLATLRALNVLALQHLTVITSALAGALGMYLSLCALSARDRWLACVVAIIYISAPASLCPMVTADMYMTYMAVGVIPIVFYGNARIFGGDSRAGYRWLAAGLALVWTCHPPVAVYCTLATAVIQGGRFLIEDQPAGEWRAALAGAGWFALLGACYFASMSEMPPSPGDPLLLSLLQLGGAALGVAAIAGGILRRRPRPVLLLPPGLLLLWATERAWLVLFAITACLAAGAAWFFRPRAGVAPSPRIWETFLVLTAVSAAPATLLIGLDDPARQGALATLRSLAEHPGRFFLPVSPLVNRLTDWQPGPAGWLLFACLLGSALRGRSTAAKLFGSFALGAILTFVRVPILSEFAVAYFPGTLAWIINLPLHTRILPVAMGAVCAGGFLALRRQGTGRRFHYAALACLALAAGWGLFQTAPFVRQGWRAVNPRSVSEDMFRSENAVLMRYAYDLARHIPDYYCHGKTDSRLENRILDAKMRLLAGPDEIVRRMEEAGAETVTLSTTPIATAPAWLEIDPPLVLQPGEQRLLRFEFFDKPYEGYLILKSEHIYREYILPESGMPLAFGLKPEQSKVISLWNSGAAPEHVRFTFIRKGAFSADANFGDFGRLTLSRYEPQRSPVRLRSQLPFRAEVDMPGRGFLETQFIFLPGYAARVDGRPVRVAESAQMLVSVPLPPGRHEVEVRYVGTARLWIALWVSLAAWGALVILALKPAWLRGRVGKS